jgi:hypothetical protein
MRELHPVAKCSAGRDYRIFEGDTANADLKVNCSGPWWAACRRRRTHGPESTTSTLGHAAIPRSGTAVLWFCHE